MPPKDDVARYRENRQDEINSAALYRTLAALKPQTQLSQIYERLAMEERHAGSGSGIYGRLVSQYRRHSQLAGTRAYLVGQALGAAVGVADHRHVRARGSSHVRSAA